MPIPSAPLTAIVSLLLLSASALVAGENRDFEARCHEEVVALHDTIEGWLAGKLPQTEAAYERFSAAMADDFEIISPSGSRLDRDAIVASLRAAHGTQGATFEISVRNIRTRLLSPPLALLTYEEWQSDGSRTTARLSSVLLREDPGKPGAVAWVHLQETWLPGYSPSTMPTSLHGDSSPTP